VLIERSAGFEWSEKLDLADRDRNQADQIDCLVDWRLLIRRQTRHLTKRDPARQ
jgi:hypothetical protein